MNMSGNQVMTLLWLSDCIRIIIQYIDSRFTPKTVFKFKKL
ncbi:hypothetical protein YpsIP31758_3831 [Yersinia pseudotuberculosis IP 31758]|uniref:Uncharacterized protein n=1 Tax=Yersinia pseudotuberculosis serotype O:1b (strain IP 31758) TaxID=349747 RepID=A0A0U1R1P8_YERP3|nr:hypothetical protein YpsIP31758_3831 [Yersinia pseudotuberculosis IP 31758]